MDGVDHVFADLERAMPADRRRLRERWRGIERAQREGRPFDRNLTRWRQELAASIARREQRLALRPIVTYDEELPVVARRREIADAIAAHQVVVVCGETGSGKSTQLPKICLELGRGIEGMIGHTQPRRIAARSIAARLAHELSTPLGTIVGYKVRFGDTTSPTTLVKLMTDGILLAESQGDRAFEQYDTLILDEAHERSLNIDFLLGYLKRLLPRRPDLKLIITSATIDADRFAAHFSTVGQPAPVVMVSGRTYPVEVRYQPAVSDQPEGEPDWQRAVLDAVEELLIEDIGDMLVFLPTERHIHEIAKGLRGRVQGRYGGRQIDVLPLYARLSAAEQNRVFDPGPGRRIVLATNVAESSLTVPRIRGVIDVGTARISRYSPRSNMQRLPIEPISQASANQRMGRCGRVGPGICIRLYSEEELLQREAYTAPEIQRTNLASVVLQCVSLGLGPIDEFPFLDPPRPEAVQEGYRTLFELGAIDEDRRLTEIGRQLSRLPVDPRVGRMVLAAQAEGCLHEVLIIATALELQDPRERPLDKQQAADEMHAQFADAESDFLSYLKLWDEFHHWMELSRSKLRKACQTNFLSYNRMREWLELHRQMLQIVEQAGMRAGPRRNDYGAIHRALLTGLLSHVAARGEGPDYLVAGGGKAYLWPGSGTFAKKPKWIVAAEQVETTRRFLRCVGRIDPTWLERLAPHLIKKSHGDPYWDRDGVQVMTQEKVTLFGLAIIPSRRVRYGPLDPPRARALFIEHALVRGEHEKRAPFYLNNRQLIADLSKLEDKVRRRDLLRDEDAVYDFYDRRLPDEVWDWTTLSRWRHEAERSEPRLLYLSPDELLRHPEEQPPTESYPDQIVVAGAVAPLDYRFEPGSDADGITLTVPQEALGQIERQRLGWLVPGLLENKVEALIRSLPKAQRTQFVPVPETARRVAAEIQFGQGGLPAAVAEALSRLGGTRITPTAFQEEKLPDFLRMNIRVLDEHGRPRAMGRDLGELRKTLGVKETSPAAAASFVNGGDDRFQRDGLTKWDFGDLPEQVTVMRGALGWPAYPALVDQGTTAGLRLFDSPERAQAAMRAGLRRLFCLSAEREIRSQVDWLPQWDRMTLSAGGAVSVDDLRRQVQELLADRALFDGPAAWPRNEAAFAAFCKSGRRRLAMAAQSVANLMGPLWENWHAVRLKLEQLPAAFRATADDVRGQLNDLFLPGFLVATPWDWLVHYPRFLKGIGVRLDKLTGGRLAQDQRHAQTLAPLVDQMRQRRHQLREEGALDAELERYRWMLEELRISLFAQELGTSQPVSPQRLEKQWAKVGA